MELNARIETAESVKEMFIFGYDIVLGRLERVIHQLVELQTAE